VATLLDVKLHRAFRRLDVNGNGYVEHDDIVALVARFIAGFRVPPSSAQGKAVAAGFEDFWQSVVGLVDLDGDGRISPQEWNDGMTDAFAEPADGFDRNLRPAVEAAMTLADTDGDGRLCLDEFTMVQRAFGCTADGARAAFSRLDADGDGWISVPELIEAARAYYTGRSGSAGDWLFGPLP
jgi:Ca2+-binding EF-hand superfamily protein